MERESCDQSCGKRLPCGHGCPRACHLLDSCVADGEICMQEDQMVCACGKRKESRPCGTGSHSEELLECVPSICSRPEYEIGLQLVAPIYRKLIVMIEKTFSELIHDNTWLAGGVRWFRSHSLVCQLALMMGKHFHLQCDLRLDTKEASHLLLRVQRRGTSQVPAVLLSSLPPLVVQGRRFINFLHLYDVRPHRFLSEYETALLRFGRSTDDLYFFPMEGGSGDYLVFCADMSTCKYLFYSTACNHLCSTQRPALSALQRYEPKKKAKKSKKTGKNVEPPIDRPTFLLTNSFAHLSCQDY